MQPPTYKQTSTPLRMQMQQLRMVAKFDVTRGQVNHDNTIREKIKAWQASMTPEQIKRRFTLAEVERLAGITGKHGGRVAHHQIASALRTLGFESKRDWTTAGRNRRYWNYLGECK